MRTLMARFLKDEDGQGMVEYGLIIAGIALAVIVAIWALGPQISTLFKQIGEKLPAAPAAG